MYVLMLNLCLMAQPSLCHREQLPFLQELAYDECVLQGQLYAVDYLRGHPQWLLQGWSCDVPGT
jgi:hypothetical protein